MNAEDPENKGRGMTAFFRTYWYLIVPVLIGSLLLLVAGIIYLTCGSSSGAATMGAAPMAQPTGVTMYSPVTQPQPAPITVALPPQQPQPTAQVTYGAPMAAPVAATSFPTVNWQVAVPVTR